MKLGLLTYHNANNFGAILQAYALSEFLNIHGVQNEYINYKCNAIEERYRSNKKTGNIIKDIFSNIQRKQRDKNFSKFRKTMRISDKVYDINNIVNVNSEYDAFLVGSDQVWNFDLNGYDYTYLLNFTDKRRLSYASSIGMEKMGEESLPYFKSNLIKFHNILVREQAAQNIITDAGIEGCKVVCDPCLLLEDNYWINKTNNVKDKNYVLIYVFDANNISKFKEKYKGILDKYKIYKLGGGITFKDYLSPNTAVKFTSGPDEFISLIKNAKLVITDSFHATVFSIIFRTPFITFYRNRPGKDARIRELLELSGLENREYSSLKKEDLLVFSEDSYKKESLDCYRETSRCRLLNSLEI